ncbi:hypothetical protein E2562_021707, partial [Oryza meyeriana var. granulata]
MEAVGDAGADVRDLGGGPWRISRGTIKAANCVEEAHTKSTNRAARNISTAWFASGSIQMEGTNEWAYLPANLLDSISSHLSEPEDFVRFHAICLQWRAVVPHKGHGFFQLWMMAGRWDGDENCDNLTFYSLSTKKTIKIHVPVIKGKWVVTSGFGYIVAIDKDDDLSTVLVNPLTRETMALPRLLCSSITTDVQARLLVKAGICV